MKTGSQDRVPGDSDPRNSCSSLWGKSQPSREPRPGARASSHNLCHRPAKKKPEHPLSLPLSTARRARIWDQATWQAAASHCNGAGSRQPLCLPSDAGLSPSSARLRPTAPQAQASPGVSLPQTASCQPGIFYGTSSAFCLNPPPSFLLPTGLKQPLPRSLGTRLQRTHPQWAKCWGGHFPGSGFPSLLPSPRRPPALALLVVPLLLPLSSQSVPPLPPSGCPRISMAWLLRTHSRRSSKTGGLCPSSQPCWSLPST